MSASVNRVILVGNLGRDPTVRYSPDGAAICNISIATTESWKDKSTGERKEITEWHRVVFYNRLAEIAGEYLRKGRAVYVEGRLKTRKWQDKETGADRYSTEIVADQMQMLGGREDGEQPVRHHEDRKNPGPPVKSDYATASQAATRQSMANQAPAEFDPDIPF